MCAASILERPFDDLLREAVAFHGHLCPGQVLGVRMTIAGCRALGFEHPRQAGKRLVVLVEIDRCATDAIEALTGVSLGKRTLKHVDHGKMAATFTYHFVAPEGIQYAYRVAQGEELPSEIILPTHQVTKENVAEFLGTGF